MKKQIKNRKTTSRLHTGWNNCVATLFGLAVMAAGSESAAQTPCSEPGQTPGQTGCVTFNYRGQEVNYTTVRAADGNIWLQQNLGSTQVADTSADADAYGHMFQWGRWDDGHQLTNSAISTTAPEPNNPTGLGEGTEFLYNTSPSWWNTDADTNDTWTAATPAAVTETNGCDPCKALGNYWRLPSPTEWQAVLTGENVTNVLTAFNSNLKLATSGTRNASGTFNFVGARGYYWSNKPSTTGGKYLYYSNFIVNPTAGTLRAQGAAIRCVKILPPQPTGMVIHTENDVYAEILTDDGTLQIQAEITPAAAEQSVTWSIVPVTGTATISSTGLVTALTNGTVWAKAISTANPAVFDSLEILLAGQISLVESITVSTENNVPATITTNGGTLQVTAEILPANANQSFSWSIVDGTTTATISETGLITAQTNGTVWAKAVSAENTTIKDSLEITISNQIIPVTDVTVTTVNNVPAVITTQGGTLPLQALVFPASANQSVNWSIVNGTGTATISGNGVVSALSNGIVWAKAVSTENSATRDSLSITISGQGTSGITETVASVFNLYPNPANDVLYLASTSTEAIRVTVTDVTGRTMAVQNFEATELTTPVSISTANWSAGIYRIQIQSGSFTEMRSIIKN